MSKEICNCKDDNFIKSDGSFDVSGRFINKYAPINENPKFNIVSGKITNLNTNRSNINTINCNATKQEKLANKKKPTPYRVPYNHYRKRYTCDTNSNCITNIKIIKDKNCHWDCQKTTYGITRLVNKQGVRLRNNGGDYNNYLQSMGKTYNQHSTGIISEYRTNHDPNSYKISNTGTVYNKNLNTTDNSNCMITNQKPAGLLSQTFSIQKIPNAVRKYTNKGFSTNTSVSSKNRLIQLKYNTILGSQTIKNGYNNCINGQLCSLYQQSGPNTKMRNVKPKCKRFNFKGKRTSCFTKTFNPSGVVTITGVTVKGNYLTAKIIESNSYSINSLTFQWLRDTVEITGAVYQKYKLTDADVNTKISVKVTYIDGGGFLETAISQQVPSDSHLISATNFQGTIAITGNLVKHQVLTANIYDNDQPLRNITYQWIRVNPNTNEETEIYLADKINYTLIHKDVNNKIKVNISYLDRNNTSETVSSPLTDIIVFPDNIEGQIIITGQTIKTQTLTANITDSNGITTPYIQYEWLRIYSGSPQTSEYIIGANTENYTLTNDDVGQTIQVEASYIDDDDYIQNITSLATNTITE